jgi:ribonuclease T2
MRDQMQRYKNWNFGGIAALVLLAISAAVNAQQQRAPWPSERFNPQPQKNAAGEFDYYALVLSWSPTFCSGAAGADADQQCNRGDGKRFSFVVHGLWPQYEKGYPELCRTARKPYVPQLLIDKMLDIMPSGGLVVHEYRNHGTCSGLPPESYFALIRQLYSKIRIPEKLTNPFESQFLSPSEVASSFMRLNPEIKSDMMAISCGGAGSRLREVRFCFSKEGKPRSCGDNENQRQMCSANRMFVPPVRSTARDDQNGGQYSNPNSVKPLPDGGQNQNKIPRPRLIEGPNGT